MSNNIAIITEERTLRRCQEQIAAHEYFSLRIQRQSVCQVPKIATLGALLRIIDLV